MTQKIVQKENKSLGYCSCFEKKKYLYMSELVKQVFQEREASKETFRATSCTLKVLFSKRGFRHSGIIPGLCAQGPYTISDIHCSGYLDTSVIEQPQPKLLQKYILVICIYIYLPEIKLTKMHTVH